MTRWVEAQPAGNRLDHATWALYVMRQYESLRAVDSCTSDLISDWTAPSAMLRLCSIFA